MQQLLYQYITRQNSFDGIKNYWAKEIKENSPEDIIIAVAANKSDNYLEQQVSNEDGKNLAKELNAIFQLTSAKLGSGINELFKLIAEKYIDPSKNISESYLCKEEIIEQKNKIKLEEIRNKKKEEEKQKKRQCCK